MDRLCRLETHKLMAPCRIHSLGHMLLCNCIEMNVTACGSDRCAWTRATVPLSYRPFFFLDPRFDSFF